MVIPGRQRKILPGICYHGSISGAGLTACRTELEGVVLEGGLTAAASLGDDTQHYQQFTLPDRNHFFVVLVVSNFKYPLHHAVHGGKH